MTKLLLCLMPALLMAAGPEYSSDGQLKFPENYREWVFLSSGLGMTYGTPAAAQKQNFDNVFVNPESYRAFLQTGQWPDKTVFVLEIRDAKTDVSINKGGHTQGEVINIEVEVKDASAKTGQWTFYAFPAGPGSKSKAIPGDARCYECHSKNTAVENTFVQFYPSLFDVAQRRGTVKPGFTK